MSLMCRLHAGPESIDTHTPKDKIDSLHVTQYPATSMCTGRSNFDSCADVPTTMTSDLSGLGSIPLLMYHSFKELTAATAGHASELDGSMGEYTLTSSA